MTIFALEKQETGQLFETLLHTGIHTYKKKQSKASLPAHVEAEKKENSIRQGAIFVVRQKADFTANGVKGYIVTSKETLLEDAPSLTHFTPNVYRTFGYTDDSRRFIYGFEERNLQQINTFVVDIDTKKYSVNELLMACMDASIGLPTFIVASDRGYQLYFVLESPLFISNKEYVEAILALHVKNGTEYTVSFGSRTWYKFKKEREDRTCSHYDEWEEDIIEYITAEKASSESFIWRTQKELCEAIGMAQSTLNEVLKRSTQLIKTVTGKGRGAKTGWTIVKLFIQYAMELMNMAREKKATYRKQLTQVIKEWTEELEIVAGYVPLMSYLESLFFKESASFTDEHRIRGSS